MRMRSLRSVFVTILLLAACNAGVAAGETIQKTEDASGEAQLKQGKNHLQAKEYAKAIVSFEKAAAQGNLPGLHQLARCYWYGWGVEMDQKKARSLFTKAAEAGYAEAQFVIGQQYYSGDGIEKDYQKAAEWFEKAAAQGNVLAEEFLGRCYRYGRGVSGDQTKALEWLEKAAAKNHGYAQAELAEIYLGGIPSVTDKEKGLAYLEATANNPEFKKRNFYAFITAYAYITGCCIMTTGPEQQLLLVMIDADPEKGVKYAQQYLNSDDHRMRLPAIFLLAAGNILRGEPNECYQALQLLSTTEKAVILAVIFVLLLIFLFVLCLEFKKNRDPADNKIWRLRDFFFAISLTIPLMASSIFATGLLPFGLALNTILFTCLIWLAIGSIFVLIIKKRGSNIRDAFGLRGLPMKRFLGWVSACYGIALAVNLLYGAISSYLKIDNHQAVASIFLSPNLSFGELVILSVSGMLLIPILEELIFRGILYQSLRSRIGVVLSLLLSGAVFSMIHMSASTFIPLMLLGMIFAYAYEKTRSLYVPIALHCANNTLALMIVLASR